MTLVVVADIEGYRGHDHGNNTCCQQRRAMSIATRAVNDYRRCQQQCDVATTIRDRSNNGRCQRQRTVPATTNDASNNARCRQQYAMPATTNYACDHGRCQQQCAIPATTRVSTTTGDVDSNTEVQPRAMSEPWAMRAIMGGPATTHAIPTNNT